MQRAVYVLSMMFTSKRSDRDDDAHAYLGLVELVHSLNAPKQSTRQHHEHE